MPQPDTSERPQLAIRDIRLLLPALILWTVTASALHWGTRGIGAITLGLLIALAAGYLHQRKKRHQQRIVNQAPRFFWALLAITLIAAASLSIRIQLAQQPQDGEVAELSGTIATRPRVSPVETKTGTQQRFTRYTLATPQGEAILTSRDPTILPAGARVTVLARNKAPADTLLSRGEWSIISVRNVAPSRGLWTLSNYLYRNWDTALSLLERAHVLTPAQHSLTRGLTVGDTSGMSKPHKDAYRAAGLSHLTAVSGANVAYLLLFINLLLKRRTPRQIALTSALALALFAAVVGPEPSILRASISGAIGVLALYTGHRKQALPALGAGIILLILICPTFATSPGFTLSVTATLALIVAAAPVRDRLHHRAHIPGRIADILSLSLVAHLATLPLTVLFFGQISTCGIIANMVVAPTLPIITALGMLGILTSALQPAIGASIIVLAWPAIRWVELIGTTLGTGSWTLINVPPGVISALITISAVTTLALLATSRSGQIVLACTLTLLSTLTAAHWAYMRPSTTECRALNHSVTHTTATTKPPRIERIPHPVRAADLPTLPPADLYIQEVTTSTSAPHGMPTAPSRPIRTPSGVPVLRLPPGTQVHVEEDGRICVQSMAI